MSSTSELRDLRRPVVIAAFGGWNDAGDAATGVIDHLAELTDASLAFTLDPDDYYDFTENRPVILTEPDGRRVIQWPTVEVFVGHLPERDLVLVGGPEPHVHWREFCSRLVSAFRTVRPERVILLGAMLADTPHRRPVQVTVDASDYEGPTGIVGVLAQAVAAAGLEVKTLWAAVPHYVADPPNLKATLALLSHLEDILDETVDLRDLPRLAAAWEGRVDDLAADDPDITSYITSLEESYDEAVVAGDEIAEAFERYLRRRNR